jgi:hypothetical protein
MQAISNYPSTVPALRVNLNMRLTENQKGSPILSLRPGIAFLMRTNFATRLFLGLTTEHFSRLP